MLTKCLSYATLIEELLKSHRFTTATAYVHCANCVMAWGPRRRGPRDQLFDILTLEKYNVRQKSVE